MMRESHLPRTVQASVAISMQSIRKKKPFESFLMKLRSRDEREFILELIGALYIRKRAIYFKCFA